MSFRKKNKDMKIAHAEDSPQQAKKSQTKQQAAPTSNEPPDGTSAEVMEWVGGDPEKAQAALDKEQAHEKPRSGLSEDLQEVIDKANTQSDDSASTSTTNEDGDTTTTTTTTTETETSTKTSDE